MFYDEKNVVRQKSIVWVLYSTNHKRGNFLTSAKKALQNTISASLFT